MADKKQERIDPRFEDLNRDGVDRRGFLKCMAWAGTGLVWTVSGGIPGSRIFASSKGSAAKGADFNFVQISDSHIGFDKPANTDVTATLEVRFARSTLYPRYPTSSSTPVTSVIFLSLANSTPSTRP